MRRGLRASVKFALPACIRLHSLTISSMTTSPWTIRGLRPALASGNLQPPLSPTEALAQSNGIPAATRISGRTRHGPALKRRALEAMPRGKGGPSAMDAQRALGPAHLSEGLLRPGRRAHQLRRAASIAICNGVAAQRFLAGGAASRRRRSHHRQDAPASAGLWHHRRESGVRRLPAARQSHRADRRLVKRRRGQRA